VQLALSVPTILKYTVILSHDTKVTKPYHLVESIQLLAMWLYLCARNR